MRSLLIGLISGSLAVAVLRADQPAVTSYAAIPASANEVTLFAFDNYSIPFLRNLAVTMQPVKKYPGNPVLRRGGPGTPDEFAAQLYGSVLRIGDKFRMWYLAGTPQTVAGLSKPVQDFMGWSVCYAESADGLTWTKPDLGLVGLNGNKHNNIVQLMPYAGEKGPPPGPGNVLVLFEPHDPEPAQRYKMMLLVEPDLPKNINNILPFFSADGLHWRQAVPGRIAANGDVAPEAVRLPLDHFEMGGLYHFQHMYYVTGQQETPYSWLPDGSGVGRSMSVFRSPDFLHWSETRTLGFVRWGYHSAPVSQGEEVHMPAASWNRGNVLVGLYGQFHGRPHSKLHPLDLGFLISNDGIHFREALNDYAIIPHDPASKWESGGVVQGQAFVNVGEETFVYYCGWDGDVTNPATHSEVGLARLRRDGFGSLSPKRPGTAASLVTCGLAAAAPVQVWINAEGLSAAARLKVEVLDEDERPLPDWAAADAAVVDQSGTRILLHWKHGDRIAPPGLFHLRVSFEGEGATWARLYAVYVGHEAERPVGS